MLPERAVEVENANHANVSHRGRVSNALSLTFVILLLVAAASSPLALIEYTCRDFSYGSTCVAAATGEKPESKLWWNDGEWWAVLFNSSRNAYHIYQLGRDQSTWNDTNVVIDDRPGSKSDVLWDGHDNKLYIVSHVFVDVGSPVADPSRWGRLYRFTYAQPMRSYILDAGFPVTVSRGVSETMTLAKDSTGRLWITYVEDAKVMVNHSVDDDTNWSTPTILPVSEQSVALTTDDISSVIAFGRNSIGVMWSNQATKKMYFAVHRDSDAEGVWGTEEIAYPDSADDHINLKADSSGRIYAAVKTSFEQRNAPLVMLLVREPGGKWSNHVFGLVKDHHTRPIVLLDEGVRRLYVFATSGGKNPGAEVGGSIYYKVTSIDPIEFSPGRGDAFIGSAADPLINNATSTKQNVDSKMGIVVLASDSSTRHYLHRAMSTPSSSNLLH